MINVQFYQMVTEKFLENFFSEISWLIFAYLDKRSFFVSCNENFFINQTNFWGEIFGGTLKCTVKCFIANIRTTFCNFFMFGDDGWKSRMSKVWTLAGRNEKSYARPQLKFFWRRACIYAVLWFGLKHAYFQ